MHCFVRCGFICKLPDPWHWIKTCLQQSLNDLKKKKNFFKWARHPWKQLIEKARNNSISATSLNSISLRLCLCVSVCVTVCLSVSLCVSRVSKWTFQKAMRIWKEKSQLSWTKCTCAVTEKIGHAYGQFSRSLDIFKQSQLNKQVRKYPP